MLHDPESRFLVLATRLYLETARDGEALEYLQADLDMDMLLREASRQGVEGLLATQLQRLQRSYDLDFAMAPFSEALRHSFARNGNHLAGLTRLGDALRENQARAIVLKGAALLDTHYGGHIGLRPLSDIDLLLKPPDIPLIRKELVKLGYRPANPRSGFYTNGSAAFDLHTDLVGASRIRRRADAARFDMDSIWESALPLKGGGGELLVLSPPFQFLHLAVHGLKHSFSRLIWLVDLAIVARQLNWHELIELARETGTIRPLTYAFSALESCLALEIPMEVRDHLVRLNRIEKVFLNRVKNRRNDAPFLGEPLLAFSIPSWGGRLAYLLEYVLPKRETLAHDSSSTPSWLLYPRRLGQALARGLVYLKMFLRSRASAG